MSQETLLKEAAELQQVALQAVTQARQDDAGDWSIIKTVLTANIKKRGMPKTAVTALVELVYSWTLESEIADNETLLNDALQFLADITDGKIFVELHRARVLRRIAAIMEKNGDRKGAKDIMQDLQVEAFTTMAVEEKVEFVVEQMRLVLAEKDYVRTQIVSKKLNEKTLNSPSVQVYKDKFYRYLSCYYVYENLYLEAAKCMKELLVFVKPREQDKNEDEEEVVELVYTADQSKDLLCTIVTFFMLAEPSEDRTKALNDLMNDKFLMKFYPELDKHILQDFLGSEMTLWPTPIDAEIKNWSCINDSIYPDPEKRYDLLRKKVLLKNFQVVSKYFSVCSLAELAQLCNSQDVDEVEVELASSICKDYIKAKIDKPQGSVTFVHDESASVLRHAGIALTKGLQMISTISNDMEREYLVNGTRISGNAK